MVGVLTLAEIAFAGARPEVQAVALATKPDGTLMILSTDASVWALSVANQLHQVRSPRVSDDAFDLAVVPGPEGDATIILTCTTPERLRGAEQNSSHDVASQVLEVTSAGRERAHRGVNRGVLTGLTVDLRARIAYAVNARTGELHRVPLNSDLPMGEPIARVPGDPGPLAFDPAGFVYAGDIRRDRVYRVSLATQEVSVITGVGRPVALTMDTVRHRLLVADARNALVWTVDTLAWPREKSPLRTSIRLKEPSSLALGSEDTVWVGDLRLGAVLLFDATGAVRRRFPR